MNLTDNELEYAVKKAGAKAFLGWIRWAYDLGNQSASEREQKLQDENQALRDQVALLEDELMKYKLPSTDPR